MNRFIPFGICTCLLFLVYLTSCRGDDTTTQAVTSTGTSKSPSVQVVKCTTLTTSETCCNKTNPGCSWVECLNTTASVNHSGCHNLSDTADKRNASNECKVDEKKIVEKVTCGYKPSNDTTTTSTTTTTTTPTTTTTQASTTTPAPAAGTCESFTNQSKCCGIEGLKLNCLYVNCTKQDPKGTAMCLNSTNVESKCPGATVICNSSQISTTPAPTSSTLSPITTTANTTTTKAPPPTTLAPHTGTTEHGQHFDGASFIGGMILMAGLFIIGFFALKFYRARKDRSYRTL